MALWASGDLNVAAHGGILLEFDGEIALHHLHVIKIHLHFEIGSPYVFADGVRIALSGDDEAGHVAGVDGFKQQGDVVLGQSFSGVS